MSFWSITQECKVIILRWTLNYMWKKSAETADLTFCKIIAIAPIAIVLSEVYSGLSRISNMEHFAKIGNRC